MLASATPKRRRCSRCCPASPITWRTSPADAGGLERRPSRQRAPPWRRCWRRPGIPRGRSCGAIIVPRDLEPGTLVFHAGTERDPDGALRVHGGRVLTVTGLGETVGEAARRSTDACELITFSGKTYRRDIGWRETREARAG